MKNIIFILIIFLLFLPANCFSASDKIYSWIDEDASMLEPSFETDKRHKTYSTAITFTKYDSKGK
ncbi:MAG: hypothetical protein JRJ39_01435 [Deltaproteobacteria bacterium]|nr:hypothetical protein [Deltaproteobacteria bacterium]